MSHVLNRSTMALTALAVVAGGALLGAPAQAAPTSVTQIRQADLIAPSDTADGGVSEFLTSGLHLKTTNASGYARGTFKVGVPLSAVTAVDFTWYGTDFSPGIKYYVDVNGDGKVDGELRGEDSYGTQDVWLNGDTQAYPGSGLADNFFASHAPCTVTTVNPGAAGPCGSSGADAHGTLADWTKLLQAATGKAPVVVNGGYSLTGAAGDGVLTQITYGPNQYVFTSAAKSKVSATAKAQKATLRKSNKVKLLGTVTPAGPGATITLQVKQNGKWVTQKTRALAASGDFKLGGKPVKIGTDRFRVTVSETNSTAAATSNVVKIKVTR
jgi:hypothetical protein